MELPEQLINAIKFYEKGNLEKALDILDGDVYKKEHHHLVLKIYSSIYLKKREWSKFIETNNKLLDFKEQKKQSLINIGHGKYNLGKISEAINYFENSIKENGDNELVHQSLGVCYMEKGKYEKSIENFVKALDLNKNNFKSAISTIYLLNFIKPRMNVRNNILSANEKIITLNQKIRKEIPDNNTLKEILEKGDKYIEEYCDDVIYKESQIFRRDSERLNCDRHFKVFNKFKVIPKYCFSCYKIQITVENVMELIKLFFLFNCSYIEKSVLRKCMVETRNKVKGNYKGLIYFKNLDDSVTSLAKLKKKINTSSIKTKAIEIKHGCTEFYNEYPEYKDINFTGPQKMNYKDEWSKYEDAIDSENTKNVGKESLYTGSTVNLLTLADLLIIRNWLNYAKLLGDKSFEKIFTNNIRINYLENVLKNQLDFRINEL